MKNIKPTVILFSSKKGGCGKTTSSVTVATELNKRNPELKTVHLDYDLRNQSNKFNEKRKEDQQFPEIFNANYHLQDTYKNTEADIVRFVEDLKEFHKIIIIDTSANDSKDMRVLSQLADIIFIPTSDSDNDLDQTQETLELMKENILDNPVFRGFGHTVKVLINNVNAHRFNSKFRIINNVKDYLKDFDSSFFMNSVISSRVSYRKILATGKIASEIDAKAKPEIDNLINEIEELIITKQQLTKEVA